MPATGQQQCGPGVVCQVGAGQCQRGTGLCQRGAEQCQAAEPQRLSIMPGEQRQQWRSSSSSCDSRRPSPCAARLLVVRHGCYKARTCQAGQHNQSHQQSSQARYCHDDAEADGLGGAGATGALTGRPSSLAAAHSYAGTQVLVLLSTSTRRVPNPLSPSTPPGRGRPASAAAAAPGTPAT